MALSFFMGAESYLPVLATVSPDLILSCTIVHPPLCTLCYLPQGWSLGACKMSLAEWAVCTCTLFMDCSKNGFHKTPLLALRLRFNHHIRACSVRIIKATICMMQIEVWGKGNKRPTPCAELQLLLECLWTQKADARICGSRSINVIDTKKISVSFLCKNEKKQNSNLWLIFHMESL